MAPHKHVLLPLKDLCALKGGKEDKKKYVAPICRAVRKMAHMFKSQVDCVP